MSAVKSALLGLVFCFAGGIGSAQGQLIQDFTQGVGLWRTSPQRIGRSKTPGWKIVSRSGGKALRNSATGSKATYYWRIRQVFDLSDLMQPKFALKYEFRGHGYTGMTVQIGPAKARRKSAFTTIYETTEANGTQRIELDLSEHAGEIRQLRVVLRKPRGVVETKVGLYIHHLELVSENTVSRPECVPYSRRLYRHWSDEDRDCQDTRQESLIADASGPITYLDKRQCRVFAGDWNDPYTGLSFDNPLYLDIDHVVPLKEAHESGAWAWDAEDRKAFANQLTPKGQLFAVQAAANRIKGAKDPAEWLPKNEVFQQEYARAWIQVKREWGLTADAAELNALKALLGDDPTIEYPEKAAEVNCNQ